MFIFTGHEKYFLNKCISTGCFYHWYYAEIYLKKITKITKSKFTVAVNSGTSALHLALIAANLKKNERVLMPAFNFVQMLMQSLI